MSDEHGIPDLVVLAGLPGVGKTTLARTLAARLGAVHLRIDTIEAALNASGMVEAAGGWDAAPDAGYRVAYGLAHDLLEAGRHVIADSVNPLAVTREAWARVATRSGARLMNVEVDCSDERRHRERVETRVSDLDGLVPPTWQAVRARHYESWHTPVLRVDTVDGVETAAVRVVDAVRGQDRHPRQ